MGYPKPSLVPPGFKIFETVRYLEDLIVSVNVFSEVWESQLKEVLCLGNKPSTWVMCYRLESPHTFPLVRERTGAKKICICWTCSIPPEFECKLAPHGSDARANPAVPQAAFGTVAGRG